MDELCTHGWTDLIDLDFGRCITCFCTRSCLLGVAMIAPALKLIHGQVTIIFVVSVCLFVCAEFFLSRL